MESWKLKVSHQLGFILSSHLKFSLGKYKWHRAALAQYDARSLCGLVVHRQDA